MKIYVISDGDYCGCDIITATTNEKVAQEIKNRFQNDYHRDFGIDVFEDGDAEALLKPRFFVGFDEQGNIIHITPAENPDCYYREEGISEDISGIKMLVVADNKEMAKKIAVERRTKYLTKK